MECFNKSSKTYSTAAIKLCFSPMKYLTRKTVTIKYGNGAKSLKELFQQRQSTVLIMTHYMGYIAKVAQESFYM
jgi:hypothetical protein